MVRRVARRGSSLVFPPPKRAMRWLGSTLRTGAQALGANLVVLDQSFAQAQIAVLGDFTVTRVRGLLTVASDQSVATEEPFGALGMMVVREDARNIGVTALSDPYTQAFDSGWFLHQYWRAAARVGTDVSI